MITEQAVYRNGWQMIKAHGDQAQEEAERYAAGLARKGDKEGSQLWNRVATAIVALKQPATSEAKH